MAFSQVVAIHGKRAFDPCGRADLQRDSASRAARGRNRQNHSKVWESNIVPGYSLPHPFAG